jgi:serine/threonine protein kinase
MARIETDRWRRLSPYLDHALEIEPAGRQAWLETLRRQDPALASDLQGLLAEHGALDAEGFLEQGGRGSPELASLAGRTVGAYTLEEPVGRGGMGTVWTARRSDGRFEGRVAVKFLNLSLMGQGGEERFRREGSFLARVAHPNIAHLLDSGVTADGQPYLVLEYVEGQDIASYCFERSLGLAERLELFLEVVAAVAHAHANLIVHRDIKPSNVLVTPQGHVKLLDFGIAKLLEPQPGELVTPLTRESGQALTLAYAAPEQLNQQAITTGTDIYALGVLLYLLLTGRHPAEPFLRSHGELIQAILGAAAPPPSAAAEDARLRRALGGDLDTIVLKALKKSPAERYPSATALAEDLRLFIRHQPIRARPDTLAYRARMFLRRNRTASALAGVAVAAVAAGVTGTVLQARAARGERDFAYRQLERAEALNNLNNFLFSDATPSGEPISIDELISRAEKTVRRRAADDATKADLLVDVGRLYVARDEYAQARTVLESAYQLARGLADPLVHARAACSFGQALANGKELARAEALFAEGLAQLPEDPRFALGRAECLMRGTEIADRNGHAHEQVLRAEAAQRALQTALIRADVAESDVLVELAGAYEDEGKVDLARAAFQRALEKLTALGRDDANRAATLYNNWGVALWLWGQPLE